METTKNYNFKDFITNIKDISVSSIPFITLINYLTIIEQKKDISIIILTLYLTLGILPFIYGIVTAIYGEKHLIYRIILIITAIFFSLLTIHIGSEVGFFNLNNKNI